MKNAGKACNNRLYRHIRTFEKIVKNYFVISCYIKEISHLWKMADVVSSETQYGNGHHVAACQYQRRDNHQNTEQNVIFLIVYSPM